MVVTSPKPQAAKAGDRIRLTGWLRLYEYFDYHRDYHAFWKLDGLAARFEANPGHAAHGVAELMRQEFC